MGHQLWCHPALDWPRPDPRSFGRGRGGGDSCGGEQGTRWPGWKALPPPLSQHLVISIPRAPFCCSLCVPIADTIQCDVTCPHHFLFFLSTKGARQPLPSTHSVSQLRFRTIRAESHPRDHPVQSFHVINKEPETQREVTCPRSVSGPVAELVLAPWPSSAAGSAGTDPLRPPEGSGDFLPIDGWILGSAVQGSRGEQC